MNYSRKANPNASSSELDPRFKTIKPFIQLTSEQRDDLIERFTEIVVDGMDMQALIQYAQEQMANYFDGLSDVELREEVNNHDEELYDELVDNIISEPVVEEVEACITDGNDYADCVDKLVDSMDNNIHTVNSPKSPLFP
tara:strand:+ start:225 stop:644 length:420 start_codon:yes stop_codon:yes gene_type:complete